MSVKNFSKPTTENDLKNFFGCYGTIISILAMRDGDEKSKCFGFVSFENADDAAQAVEGLDGNKSDDEKYVGRPQNIYLRDEAERAI